MTAPRFLSESAATPILLVEDDPSLREALEVTLAMEDIAFIAVDSAEDAITALRSGSYRVLVSDIRLPKASGLDLLFEARKIQGDLPVVLMTAYADASTAVEALRGGARDFLLKPFKPEQFVDVIKRYLPDGEWQAQSSDGPVAVDPQSRQLLHKLERVAQTDATVLLTGESGSGKEVMAQYLHQRSTRSKQNFVAINCAAIPSTLLEATLFGHERGAFTGASKSQPGKFELAQSGTIFLDEIGEMPLELQTKLLRVLQERQVERVGSHQTISLDVRVIAATNQDLTKRQDGRPRPDPDPGDRVLGRQVHPHRQRDQGALLLHGELPGFDADRLPRVLLGLRRGLGRRRLSRVPRHDVAGLGVRALLRRAGLELHLRLPRGRERPELRDHRRQPAEHPRRP